MTAMRRELPTGTVTFLFTDIEGSTKLLHELGAEAYADALADPARGVRRERRLRGGYARRRLLCRFPHSTRSAGGGAGGAGGVRPGADPGAHGLHTGTPHLAEEGYVGADVHRAARIAACGNGGQVLVSASTAALAGTDGLRDLGVHRLKDLSAPERIYQLGEQDFPALKSLYRTNLPIPSTPFLGRKQELQEVLGF